MIQTIDHIDRQARQGSVAAIIQILNDHFSDSQVRTRAVLDQGVLQLLCEAPTAEQVPQTEIVSRVKSILESVSPRGISKVNINGRIVREQQLLWLEAIKRDPEKQLLWSELITLKTPNPITRLWQDLNSPRQRNPFADAHTPRRRQGSQGAFWRGILGGASLCLFLLVMGWALRDWLGSKVSPPTETVSTPEPLPQPSPEPQDPFAQAVRIAQSAAEDGQSASTPAEWLDLAARWRRAADLMAEVPADDKRYDTAQQRVAAYRENSAVALEASNAAEAQNSTSPATP